MQCFGYFIKNNTFTFGDIITTSNDKCKDGLIYLQIESFPEIDEFIFGCKGIKDKFFIGKYSPNFDYINYCIINITIPDNCKSSKSFQFIYSYEIEKYLLFIDMGIVRM